MSAIGQEVRIQDVEPGRRYRFTTTKPVVEGSRARTIEAEVMASFWGEVPLKTEEGVIRVERGLICRAVEIY